MRGWESLHRQINLFPSTLATQRPRQHATTPAGIDGNLGLASGTRLETMLKTIEVEIDHQGQIRPVDGLRRLPPGRALLTLLSPPADETALLAEAALAEDWLKPEEDEAWADLHPGK